MQMIKKKKVGLLIYHKAFEGVETNVISSFTFRGLNLHRHGCDVKLAESQMIGGTSTHCCQTCSSSCICSSKLGHAGNCRLMWKHGECSRFLPQNYCLHLGFLFQSHILRHGTVETSLNEMNCVLKLLHKQLRDDRGTLVCVCVCLPGWKSHETI